jgi:hypothetical protein
VWISAWNVSFGIDSRITGTLSSFISAFTAKAFLLQNGYIAYMRDEYKNRTGEIHPLIRALFALGSFLLDKDIIAGNSRVSCNFIWKSGPFSPLQKKCIIPLWVRDLKELFR